jgi:hypothetical protein
MEAKRSFVTEASKSTSDLPRDTRTPDADVHLERTDRILEGSTFLTYPWTVMVLGDLAGDPALAAAERRQAHRNRDELLALRKEISAHLQRAITYELAENLFCLSRAIAARH